MNHWCLLIVYRLLNLNFYDINSFQENDPRRTDYTTIVSHGMFVGSLISQPHTTFKSNKKTYNISDVKQAVYEMNYQFIDLNGFSFVYKFKALGHEKLIICF